MTYNEYYIMLNNGKRGLNLIPSLEEKDLEKIINAHDSGDIGYIGFDSNGGVHIIKVKIGTEFLFLAIYNDDVVFNKIYDIILSYKEFSYKPMLYYIEGSIEFFYFYEVSEKKIVIENVHGVLFGYEKGSYYYDRLLLEYNLNML